MTTVDDPPLHQHTENSNYIIRRSHASNNNNKMTVLMAVLSWLLFLLPSQHVSASYMIALSKGGHECLVLRARTQVGLVSGNYDCLEDDVTAGMVRAELWIDSENHTRQDVVWFSHEPHGMFSLPSQPSGKYTFCLYHVEEPTEDMEHQHKPEQYPKEGEQHGDTNAHDSNMITFGFNIYLEPPIRTLEDKENGPDGMRALALVQEAASLELYCRNLLDHFDYLRQRETIHHYMADILLRRVMQWTILEAILLVIMAIAQVWYFTKFFEQTRYL